MEKKKLLIIGGAGFVGGHLIQYLKSETGIEIYATKLENEINDSLSIKSENIINLDITNSIRVKEVLASIRPDYIIHLAAQSSVAVSWKRPVLTFDINVNGTINILEAVKELEIRARVLLIGSAEQYGIIKPEDLPIKEETEIHPSNPYAVSKATQEAIARMYVSSYNMDIVMVRAFNHIGPGQSPIFVISDFAKQIADIEKGLREPVIYVGNLEAKRDFTDVRDIVRGYWLLLQKGKKGEIYNIGSGESFKIQHILDMMISMSNMKINIMTDENKLRPIDIKDLRSDIGKIKADIGWTVTYDIKESLSDVINYWRNSV